MFVLQLKKTLSPGGTTRDSGTFVKNIPENICVFISQSFLFVTQTLYLKNIIFGFGNDKTFDPQDPDPYIIKKKMKKNLDFYCFVTSLRLFIFEE
jgi:hypothetical protein